MWNVQINVNEKLFRGCWCFHCTMESLGLDTLCVTWKMFIVNYDCGMSNENSFGTWDVRLVLNEIMYICHGWI